MSEFVSGFPHPSTHKFEPYNPDGAKCKHCMYHERAHPKGDPVPLGNEDIVNRFGFHKATETTGPLHQDIRGAFVEIGKFLDDKLPDGRAKFVCFTELENAAMWANKAVDEQAPITYE